MLLFQGLRISQKNRCALVSGFAYRVLLWHLFGQNWGLAMVKQLVTGAGGFVYALRDDGFGLYLGRDKLGLIVPT